MLLSIFSTEEQRRNATISVVITAFLAGSTVSFAAGTMSLNCYDKFVSDNFIVEEKEMVQEKRFEEVTKILTVAFLIPFPAFLY
mgnify:CR=1 FL=1